MRKPKIELTEEIKAATKRDDLDIVTMERSYRLITPLYGGGVKTGKVDRVTPVSGKAVRGNLRFWWRAVRGGQFGDSLKSMKAKEDEIWGTAVPAKKEKSEEKPTKLPPKVNLHVYDSEIGDEFVVYRAIPNPRRQGRTQIKQFHRDKVPAYAAFPQRPEEGSPPGTTSEPLFANVTFKLKLIYFMEHQKELDAALWAWETFGGVGARSRRGFGALSCEKIVINGEEQDSPLIPKDTLENWLANQLEHYQEDTHFHDDIPHLPSDFKTQLKIVSTSPFEKAEQAWIHLIEALQQFRHKRPIRLDERGRPKPTRNKWPEPDAIRTKVSPRNRRYPAYYDPEILKYPRAEFGLPIIFELRGEGGIPKSTLRGKDHNRMGSPLILRPYQCANQQFVGLALILAGPRLPPSDLILEGIDDEAVQSRLLPDEAAQIATRDNNIYDGNVDILQSFIDSL
ncbi:type III-B CRISPR module RAMP protein Cmr1 [Candidatus Leptofilum sp.]|uniref:type III-B CRISPR module RAMP protein Cmr1 n=1 Tax=Candidatus Leptofilum sp. TaxID=3241576 RepID=UPI003B59D3CD